MGTNARICCMYIPLSLTLTHSIYIYHNINVCEAQVRDGGIRGGSKAAKEHHVCKRTRCGRVGEVCLHMRGAAWQHAHTGYSVGVWAYSNGLCGRCYRAISLGSRSSRWELTPVGVRGRVARVGVGHSLKGPSHASKQGLIS